MHRDAGLIEAVARAICTARFAEVGATPWEILKEGEREDYLRMARAAVEAQRAHEGKA